MRNGIFILFLMLSSMLNAQTYEIGAFAGGSNFIGDVGRTSYVLPSDIAVGGLFKWNKSKRYAWRASVIYADLIADDTKSNNIARQNRGYVVENSLLEVSAGLEFNFVEYNLHKLGPAFTPYLYTGVTYFRYDYNFLEFGMVQDLRQRDGAFSIPMTVGFKHRLNQFFIIGAEIGARYTFTDNIDASNPVESNVSFLLSPEFGNVFSDDWYVFSGITFTYTFGRKPCTDCFE